MKKLMSTYELKEGVLIFIKISFNVSIIVFWSFLRCPGGLPEFLEFFEKNFFFVYFRDKRRRRLSDIGAL